MNILIVDDDAAIIESICNLVNWKKLSIDVVRTASQASQAKQILMEEPVDIIVSDIEMPGESGLDLLKWYRTQQMEGKFLLLTCHESFSYARQAIKLRAEEYLLKPFRVDMIEMVLQKMVQSIQEERERVSESDRGLQFMRRRTLGLLADLLSGRISAGSADFKDELSQDAKFLAEGNPFRLVMIKATNLEKDIETYGKNLLLFTLENMASELLTGSPENARVVCFDHGRYWIMAAVCEEGPSRSLFEAGRTLIEKSGGLFSLTLTCCISDATEVEGLYSCFGKCEALLNRDVIHYGTVFYMEEACKEAMKSGGLWT